MLESITLLLGTALLAVLKPGPGQRRGSIMEGRRIARRAPRDN